MTLGRARRRLAPASLLLLLISAMPGGAVAASPTLWTYPGTCSSAETLQNCIDGAAPGDIVEIDTPGLKVSCFT